MRMYDIILDKRNGKVLSKEQIGYVVRGFTDGSVPDYQMSAFLMSVYFSGLNEQETVVLTECMARSGDMIDLSPIKGIKVDKHSTGGVGDKTTLICAPIVVACGIPVAKMSGRGLGHTGGTVDKLEAIPGYNTSLEKEAFFRIVNEIGISVIGQTGNIAPADKKIYALRDVTATVDSIPLIASSIMSKKLASGADAILLDVKTGNGAFMKTMEDSRELARQMVSIGSRMGRRMAALITSMDVPLGNAIGNALEVAEAVQTLKGKGPDDLTEVCLELAANMVRLGSGIALPECRQRTRQAVEDGSALQKLRDMAKHQGGDVRVLDDPGLFEQSPIQHDVVSLQEGYISSMDTERMGLASVMLGAGRNKKEDSIDHAAGILLKKKTGDYVKKGEVVAVLHTQQENSVQHVEKMLWEAYAIAAQKPAKQALVLERITAKDI